MSTIVSFGVPRLDDASGQQGCVRQRLHRAWRRDGQSVIAGAQDRQGALSPGEVAKRLSAWADIPWVACEAGRRANAMPVVDPRLLRILGAEVRT